HFGYSYFPLAMEQNATVSTDPSLGEGQYYVYVYTDDREQIYEDTLENNNWVGVPLYIRAYPPIDLEATAFAADSSEILPGNTFTVDYQVSNIGQGLPLANSWSDGIYLSTDSVWDTGDVLLSTVIVPGQVPPGTSYARFNETVNIPLGTTSGPYCLLLVADVFQLANDADTSNNYRCDSIFVKPTVYPDLQVNSFSCPSTGTAGQPITLNFTIENDATSGGGTTTGGWSEGFYLQTPSGQIFLGSFGYTGNLTSGATYSGSVTLTLPISLPAGFYDIIIRTDRNNIVFENQNEGNNEAVCNLQIDATPPADLIVSQIVRPDTAFTGDPLTIAWTVKNIGANPANGTMTQGVYISSDTLFSSDDVFFGSISGGVNLGSNDSASYSLTGDLLGVPEGCFHVLVRTDVLNNIIEASDANNLLAAPCMEVRIPLLPFDVLTPDTLINQQALYYRIEVDSNLIGESMIVTLTGDSTNNAFNEEYLRLGSVPSRTIYDHTVDFPFQANQTVIAPDLQLGTYYHLTYGQTNGSNEQDITLLAEILPFEIREVMVNYGGNTGPVTVKIEGGRFEPGMEARLESSTLGTIVATDVIFINATAVWATFDLIGRPIGVYDVGLYKDINSSVGLDTASLDSGFTVQQGPANGFTGGVIPGTCSPGVSEIGQLLQVVIDYPPNTRPNRIVSMTIYYENIGNVDLPIPIRFMLSTNGAPIGFTPDELAEGKTELFMEFTESGSPPGILRPGGKGSVTVYSQAVAPLTFELVE
ncbi:MAG: CARDB domain-containing protein, partial [Bacteroidota bacterium]